MGIFDNYNSSTVPTGHHSYIQPGRYFVELGATKIIEKRNKSEAFVNEVKILKVIQTYEDPLGVRNEEGKLPIASNSPVNTNASHMLNPGDYFDGELKAMWMAVEGMDAAEAADPINGITLEYIKELVSKSQPKAGVIIELDCVPIVTQAGKAFTRVDYVRSNLPHHPNCITDEELAA